MADRRAKNRTAKRLPSRPNREHLRRQAKALLAALAAGDPDAVRTFQDHLPAAQGLSEAKVRQAGFRLADAQSAIARQTGFASWPQLGRHVDTLRGLEGTWSFASLTVDGSAMPPAMLATSRILIDGDRFRSETPEATYEGTFDIDVELEPMAIDIAFAAGPEAGNTNRGIFRLDGDRFELCLDVNGGERPRAFATAQGSGHAHEVLRRTSGERPSAVDGGEATANAVAGHRDATPAIDREGFAFVPSPTLARLQGEWIAVEIVRDGMALPPHMLGHAHRSATDNEVRITIGGRTVIHALVRFAAGDAESTVDYLNLAGETAGRQQLGVFQWRGADACFCMAAPGQPRPEDFMAPAGSGRTLSVWRREV